jgi:proline iminopeptidase
VRQPGREAGTGGARGSRFRLRVRLGIERWLLWGMSWGSTLLLAYAQRYPDRVTEIVISGVTTTRRSEIDWLYQGLYRFFPQEWERFRADAGEAVSGGDLIAAYGRLMADPDPAVRARAAVGWSAWEDATISLDPGGTLGAYSARSPDLLLARARLCAHYFAHGAWLEEGQLLANAHRLAGIPGVLIHGRMDMGGFDTAWELARAWPGAELAVIERSGHSGSADITARQVRALDDFAR